MREDRIQPEGKMEPKGKAAAGAAAELMGKARTETEAEREDRMQPGGKMEPKGRAAGAAAERKGRVAAAAAERMGWTQQGYKEVRKGRAKATKWTARKQRKPTQRRLTSSHLLMA